MVIYRAREGDTVAAIARRHGVLPTLVCEQNGITPETPLVSGQAIVILPATESVQVREGDSLHALAARHKVSPAQLRRQNPALEADGTLYPGTRLTVSAEEREHAPFSVIGLTAAGCEPQALAPTLPYLTYLGVLSARLLPSGEVGLPDDGETVAAARAGGAIPLLVLTAAGEGGVDGERERTAALLARPDGGSALADALMPHLNERGYGGVLLDLPFCREDALNAYCTLIARLRRRLAPRAAVLATCTPGEAAARGGMLGRAASALLLTTYGIGSRFAPPMPETPYDRLADVTLAATGAVRPSKLFAGLSTRALDFPASGGSGRVIPPAELPAVWQAAGGIAYDPEAHVPYLTHRGEEGEHILFFEDAESFAEKLLLCERRGLAGICLFPAEGIPRALLSVLGGLFPIVRAYGS